MLLDLLDTDPDPLIRGMDLDPDPQQNVMDPQHCQQGFVILIELEKTTNRRK
jgi:hypothetical protein